MPGLPQSSERQPFPMPILPRPDIPVGGILAMGRITAKQMGPFYRTRRFQDTIQYNSPSFNSSNKS